MFAGLEGGSRVLQIALNITNERVRAPEHAPRDPLYFLERRNCLAEIVEGGVRACVEHLRVHFLHPEREIMTLSLNALRHGYNFMQQRPGFSEAL